MFNPLAYNTIIALSKLKAFEDNNFNVVQIVLYLFLIGYDFM